MLDDYKLDDPQDSRDLCSLCGQDGFLSAQVEARPFSQDFRKAHLLCALASPHVRLADLDKSLFLAKTDSNNSDSRTCCYCQQPVGPAGRSCSAENCAVAAHLHCALRFRVKSRFVEKERAEQGLESEKFDAKFWSFPFVPGTIDPRLLERELDLKFDEIAESKQYHNIARMLANMGVTEADIKAAMRQQCFAPAAGHPNPNPNPKPQTLCPNHSQNAAYYCVCGVRWEVDEMYSGSFKSVYCEDCGTWYHFTCVDSNHQMGLNNDEEAPDNWQCPKCRELGDVVMNFLPFAENLTRQAAKTALANPNILFRDHMILLNLIWENKDRMSLLTLHHLQRLLPFSIEGILDLKIQGKRLWDLFDKALELILRDKLKNTLQDAFRKAGNHFSLMDFNEINTKNIHFKQLISNLVSHSVSHEDTEPNIDCLKAFQKELLTPLGVSMNKLTCNNLPLEDFLNLARLLFKSNILQGMPVEQGLLSLVESTDSLFKKICANFADFQSKVLQLEISRLTLKEVEPHCLHRQVYASEAYSQAQPLTKKVIELTIGNLKKVYFKSLSKCLKLKDIKVGIRSNLLWCYFNFEEGKAELQAFLETNLHILEWERRVRIIQQKLAISSNFPEAWILGQKKPAAILISKEQFNVAFKYMNKSINRFIKNHDFYTELAKKDTLSSDDPEAKELSFREVMQDFVAEGIPLSAANFRVIERQSLRTKIDAFLEARYALDDLEFEAMTRDFAALAQPGLDDDRLRSLQRVQLVLSSVGHPLYPQNLARDSRTAEVAEHAKLLDHFRLKGKPQLKLRRLNRVFQAILEIRGLLDDPKPSDPAPDSAVLFRPPQIDANKKVDWTRLELLQSKIGFLEDPDLKHFDQLHAFVVSLYSRYANHLVEGFVPGEKTNVAVLLLVEKIALLLPEKPAYTYPYLKKKENLLKILEGIVELNRSNREDPKPLHSLNEFKAKVEDLVDRRNQLKNLPAEKESNIRQAFAFLDQLDLLVKALKKAKVFRAEEVNKRNFPMYKLISELLKNPALAALPVRPEDTLQQRDQPFRQFFEEVDALLADFEGLKACVAEVQASLERRLPSAHLTELLATFFRLPALGLHRQLLEAFRRFGFLEEEAAFLAQRIHEAEALERHVSENNAENHKLYADVEQFRNLQQRLHFQQYVWYLAKERLPAVWFVTPATVVSLKLLCLFNKFLPLAVAPVGLQELLAGYAEVCRSDFLTDEVRKQLAAMKLHELVLERIREAQTLKNNFLDPKPFSNASDYCRLLEEILHSRVKIFDSGVQGASPEETYAFIKLLLAGRDKDFFKFKINELTSAFDVKCLDELFDRYCTPCFMRDSIRKLFKDQRILKSWVKSLQKCRRPLRVETAFVSKELAELKPQIPGIEELTKRQTDFELLYNRLEQMTAEDLSLDRSPACDKLAAFVKALEASPFALAASELLLLVKVCLALWACFLKDQQLSPHFVALGQQALQCLLSSLLAAKEPFELSKILQAEAGPAESEAQARPPECKLLADAHERVAALLQPILDTFSQLFQGFRAAVSAFSDPQPEVGPDFCSLLRAELKDRGFEADKIKLLGVDHAPQTAAQLRKLFGDPKRSLASPKPNPETLKTAENPDSLLEKATQILSAAHLDLETQIAKLFSEVGTATRENGLVAKSSHSKNKRAKQQLPDPKPTGKSSTSKKSSLNRKVVLRKALKKRPAAGNSGEKENAPFSAEESEPLQTESELANGAQGPDQPPDASSKPATSDTHLKKREPKELHENKIAILQKELRSASYSQNHPIHQRKLFQKAEIRFAKSRSFSEKKFCFHSVMPWLDEDKIERLRLRAQLDLQLKAGSLGQFDAVVARLQKETAKLSRLAQPVIYGWLEFKNSELEEELKKQDLWRAEIPQGELWLFGPDLRRELLAQLPFSPDKRVQPRDLPLFVLDTAKKDKKKDDSVKPAETGRLLPEDAETLSKKDKKGGKRRVSSGTGKQ